MVFLQNKYLEDNDLSDNAVAVYTALRMIVNQTESKYYINLNTINFVLSSRMKPKRETARMIKDGIEELQNHSLIEIVEQEGTDYIIDLSKLIFDGTTGGYFTTIEENEIRTIVGSDFKFKFRLLHYFCYLTTTLTKGDESNKFVNCGFTSIKDMSDALQMHPTSLYRYNNLLESMQIIHFHKNKKGFIRLNGDKIANFITIPSVYGRYKDKERVDLAGTRYEYLYGKDKADLIPYSLGVSTRSATQKYNAWLKGVEYSPEELEAIYIRLRDYNKRNEQDPKRCKDLTVFSKYDFYERGD